MFGIDDAISNVANLADTVIKRVWPDATEIEKAKIMKVTQEMESEYKLLLGQIDINKIEASSSSLFVAGWRPLVGWTCGFALAYSSILEPIARFIATVIFAYTGVFPMIDTNITMQVLMALLGVAGLRSYEKKNGLTK